MNHMTDHSSLNRGPTGKIRMWTDLMGTAHFVPIDPTQVSKATAALILPDVDAITVTVLPPHIEPHHLQALVWKKSNP